MGNKFDVTLRVNADEMANLAIDYGEYFEKVEHVSKEPVRRVKRADSKPARRHKHLSRDEAKAIAAYKGGRLASDVAEQFGCSAKTVLRIWGGEWHGWAVKQGGEA